MAGSGIFKDFRNWFVQPFKSEGKSVLRVFTLCFLTASIFWVFNSFNKSYTTTIQVPVQILYDDQEYIPVEDLPQNAQILVSGFGWDLLKWSFHFGIDPLIIQPDNFSQTGLDLSNYRSELVDLLGQVELNKMVTDSLRINFDQRISRKLPLAVDTTSLKIKKSYRVKGDFKISPDSIALNGPKSIVNNMKDIFLVRIDESQIDENYDELVELDFRSNPLVKLEDADVRVEFEVEKLVEHNLELDIALMNFPDSGWDIDIDKANLKFILSESNLNLLNTDSIEIYVDFNQLNSQDSNLALTMTLPEFYESPTLSPDSVSLIKR